MINKENINVDTKIVCKKNGKLILDVCFYLNLDGRYRMRFSSSNLLIHYSLIQAIDLDVSYRNLDTWVTQLDKFCETLSDFFDITIEVIND